MVLKIQIYSFLVSFFYGIFFYFMLEINSRFIYSSNKVIKVISSFLFILFNAILYFIILLKVNNGYIHIYFFLCILVGYIMCKVVVKKVCNRR